MDSIEAEMTELLEPFFMTPTVYIESVIFENGFTGVTTGQAVLPPRVLDAAEYLRLMKMYKVSLETAKHEEGMLLTYIADPNTIPSYVREKYRRHGTANSLKMAEVEMVNALKTRQYEINTFHRLIFQLSRDHQVIDSEGFLSKMGLLLIKFVETLAQTKHEQAEHIVRCREEPCRQP